MPTWRPVVARENRRRRTIDPGDATVRLLEAMRGLAELHVLLNEHEWRQREGLG